jgi:hypothetical protein
MIETPVLPQRTGERPETRTAMPHQQLDQTAPPQLQEELWQRMTSLEGVRAGRSGVSLPATRALHLDPALALGPSDAFMAGTEFGHLHGASDGSLHLSLPAAVAEEAIEKGWAEHHPLVAQGIAPRGVVMVYGPRNEDELETVWQLVQAGYAFARGDAT